MRPGSPADRLASGDERPPSVRTDRWMDLPTKRGRTARAAARSGRHAPQPGATQHDRPATARLARVDRLGAHRPVAGAADPVGVRRGLRHARRARAGDQRVRLGADHASTTRCTPRACELGRALARGRLRGHHRRRARARWRRRTRGVARPAASRSASASSCRSRPASTTGSTSGSTSATSSPARRCSSSTRRASWCCPAASARFDELFEALTLVQTQKVTSFPIVLLGTCVLVRDARLAARRTVLAERKIDEQDLELLHGHRRRRRGRRLHRRGRPAPQRSRARGRRGAECDAPGLTRPTPPDRPASDLPAGFARPSGPRGAAAR